MKYLDDMKFTAEYKTCSYMLCSMDNEDFKDEVRNWLTQIKTLISNIRKDTKREKTYEFLIVNIIYSYYTNDQKGLVNYINSLFNLKDVEIDTFEFDELMEIWLNGPVKDIISWKKFLQVLKNVI